jgi:hypothetical protein
MTIQTWHMAAYLPVKTADYNYTLDIPPHNVMPIDGSKHQVIYELDDKTVSVVPVSTVSSFDVELQWEALSETNAGILIAMYHDTTKCNGSQKTFYWKEPFDADNTYVARFMSPVRMVRSVEYGNYLTVDSVIIRVEGVKAP